MQGLLDPLTDPRWQALVDHAPQATTFHDPAWLGLLRDHYRYPFAAATVSGADGALVAGIPVAFVSSRLTGRRLVAVPFSDSCRPLVADDAPEGALTQVLAVLEAERVRRGVPLEVRERVPGAGEPVDLFLQHVIDLTEGIAAVEGRYASQVRRNVRKARKAGVTVERRTDRGALDAFYALHLETRRRLGVPTQPKAFIRGLEPLLDRGLGFVALARHEGEVVAAAVFLRAGSTLTYKYGASSRAALQVRPNNVLFSDVIRWACEQGLAALDLGRTDDGQDGLARFKRSWGAEERALAYTYAGRQAPEPGHSRVDDLLGSVIRRAPAVTGRVAGELLYRHVG